MIPVKLENADPALELSRDAKPRIRSLTTGKGLSIPQATRILSAADTGSGTFVYSIRTTTNEYVVVKRAPDPAEARGERQIARRQKILRGLQHEWRVYQIARALVDAEGFYLN